MVDATPEDSAQAAFRDAQEAWRGALEAHRLAPPDAGFSVRLSGLGSWAARGMTLPGNGWRVLAVALYVVGS